MSHPITITVVIPTVTPSIPGLTISPEISAQAAIAAITGELAALAATVNNLGGSILVSTKAPEPAKREPVKRGPRAATLAKQAAAANGHAVAAE